MLPIHLEPEDRHSVVDVQCPHCLHRWVAVVPTITLSKSIPLECPNCHEQDAYDSETGARIQ